MSALRAITGHYSFRNVANWTSLICELPADLPMFRIVKGSDGASGGQQTETIRDWFALTLSALAEGT
jgi:hypothetical protein